MPARSLLLSVLLPALLLAACQPALASTPTAEPRTAVFAEIENEVQARLTSNDQYAAAAVGQAIPVGGQARSGEDSRARLDLLPEATIVRLGPTTEFTLTELRADEGNPNTRMRLLGGQLWIILRGGALEVETDLGTAAVRGSMMSVLFDAAAGFMKVTCLEGHCSLANDAGSTDLTEGQASEIRAPGEPPTPPRPMNDEEYIEWKKNVPETYGSKPPGEVTLPPTIHYTVINQCAETRFFLFSGPTTVAFDLGPGMTTSGDLPRGEYTVSVGEPGGLTPASPISADTWEYTLTTCTAP